VCLYVEKFCVSKLCESKLCVSKLCDDKLCVNSCGQCIGLGREGTRDDGRRRRRTGYRTKNKNPTQRCGEKQFQTTKQF